MTPRTLGAGSARVAWRRAGSERGLLVGVVLLVGFTAFLGLSGPRLMDAAADDAVRAAVRDAGARADVVVSTGASVGAAAGSGRDAAAAVKVQNAAAEVRGRLPAEVRDVTGEPSAAAMSGPLTVQSAHDGGMARFVWLWRTDTVAVTWVDGGAPRASLEPVAATVPAGDAQTSASTADPATAAATHVVEVGLTRADADAVGAHVGDRLAVTGTTRGAVEAVVSGIYLPVDATDPLWTTVPGLLEPTPVGAAGASVASIGLLLSDASLPDVARALQPGAVATSYRFPVVADAVAAADIDTVRARVAALVANPAVLTLAAGVTPTVTTELGSVLTGYLANLRGAMSQASVLLVGLVTVGVLTLVLAGRLVVGRREPLLAAERARGGSVASVALRLALESVPLAMVGFGLGVLGSWLLDRTTPWTWWPGIAVAVVAACAVPAAGARVAAASWTGLRSPANRKDRERLHARRRARRTVVELAVVVLALAATSAARTRGVQQTQTDGVDLLLAATPVLLACAATVVVLRVFPAVLRALTRSAANRRGLVPLVATSRATRTRDLGLPLLALTVALGLVVFAGVTAESTHRGEERAAVEVVGADVRLDGVLAPGVGTALRTADGVTALATGARLTGRTVNDDPALKATVLVVDTAAYGTIAAAHDARYTGELAQLPQLDGAGPSGRPRAVVSRTLAREVAAHGARVFVGGASVELDVVGTTDLGPPGELFVVVDRTALAPFTPDPIEPDRTWVDGRGAVAAVAAASADRTLMGVTVTDRVGWLTHLRDSPLVGSLVALLSVTALILALFAAITLVLTVTATSAERGRTFASLRTLGLGRGTTWRITLGELAPLTTAGVLAGALIGLGVPLVLTGALGLNQLTGEAGDTAVVITGGPFALAAGASVLALLLSVAAEALVRRRDDLGQVLRVGGR